MLSKVRGAGLLVQVLAAIWALACGRVDVPIPPMGTGGASSGEQATGGALSTSSGGSTVGSAFGTGGQETGLGGVTGIVDPTLDACGLPLGTIEPPCAEGDVLVPSGCTFGDSVEFRYPAADLAVPTAAGLRMVLLPRSDAGMGGASGEPSGEPSWPYELPVRIVPDTAGSVAGNTFSLNTTDVALMGYFPNVDDDMNAYMREQPADPSIREGTVAIISGETVLDQHRIVVPPFLVCPIK